MADGELPGYSLGKKLGIGKYGVVYKATRISDGAAFAAKQISLAGVKRKEKAAVLEEVKVLKMLHHPRIVRFISTHYDDSEDVLSIITELCAGGDLEKEVSRMPEERLPSNLAPLLLRGVLEALNYIHLAGVLHRDIKVRCPSL